MPSNGWGEYLADTDPELDVTDDLRREHVEGFLYALADQGPAPATINQRYRSLMRSFGYLVEEGRSKPTRWRTYGRARSRHSNADRPELWLTQKGYLTNAGLAKMLQRRCRQAKVPEVHLTSSGTRSPTNGCLRAATRATSCGSPAGGAARCSRAMPRPRPTSGRARHTPGCSRGIATSAASLTAETVRPPDGAGRADVAVC